MTYNYTNTFRSALELCYEETQRLGIKEIDPDLLVWGVLKEGANVGVSFLVEHGLVIRDLVQGLEECLSDKITDTKELALIPAFDRDARQCISIAAKICAHRQEMAISPLHLIQGVLLSPTDNYLKHLFTERGIIVDYGFSPSELSKDDLIPEASEPPTTPTLAQAESPDEMEETEPTPSTSTQQMNQDRNTPMLETYGLDLVEEARRGGLDPMVGRSVELERVIQILGRRKKSNPILVGEAGVGKTALVEGLAQRILKGEVPLYLQDKRIVSLDLGAMVAGTKYRGQFEERLKSLMKELENRKDIILFIDEIHTIIGAGGTSGGLDTANMLKPSLSRGSLRCIGTTTLAEYRKHIEKDGALERRFQKVLLSPNTAEETLQILHNIKSRYEAHHGVIYSDEALKTIVELSERFLSSRSFPDKAIDILDEAGARARGAIIQADPLLSGLEEELEEVLRLKLECIKEQKFELAASYRNREREIKEQINELKTSHKQAREATRVTIDAEAIASIVSMMSGVPVDRVAQAETEKLRAMKETLKQHIVGQDNAIDTVVRAIQRSRLGLRDPKRPIGSFLFLGPTGVGKTYLAKKISQELFGSEEAMIRVDMSEYMEKFAVSRLVGSPPGYVGYEEGGQLTEQVRKQPYSVVLIDEIEKAHPDVYNLLLQVLDEGVLTDSEGRRVDFRNTIIIITSNVGSRQAKDFARGIGFEQSQGAENRKQGIMRKALEKTFSPEFLNRLDEIVEFTQLDAAALRSIVEIELRPLIERVAHAGYHIKISDGALDVLAKEGYDPSYGARPLRRLLQKEVEDRLTDLILSGTLSPGDTLHLGVDTTGKLTPL